MTAIGPGDWVECVDNAPRPWHFGPYIEALEELRVGGVYQVRAIDRAGDLFLAGILTGSERLGFGPDALGFDESRFRLIYRPKADLIERLMEPVPDEPVKVKA